MAMYEEKGGRHLLTWPDSAAVKSGKPVFLAQEEGMVCFPGIAAKIIAVGKSISAKFAGRYYDEVIPICYLADANTAARLRAGEDPLACEIMSDFCLVAGNALEKSRLSDIRYQAGNQRTDFSWQLALIDEAIGEASRRNTLKTGDIAGAIAKDGIDIQPEMWLTASLGGTILIENKLK